MLQKCCFFSPFHDKKDFLTFDDRWKFLHSDVAKETMYWDSERLMQNIQDVENSKKIISVQDEVAKKTNITETMMMKKIELKMKTIH
jgi:hypothetical protein